MDHGNQLGLWTYAGFLTRFDSELREEIESEQKKLTRGRTYSNTDEGYIDPDDEDAD